MLSGDKSGGILCYFRGKCRNKYKIKCLKTDNPTARVLSIKVVKSYKIYISACFMEVIYLEHDGKRNCYKRLDYEI